MMLYRTFAELGYKVFGLYGGNHDGSCKCRNTDCNAAFKHPMFSNWQHTPDWSDEAIETMEKIGTFDTGYGVLVKGLLVIDIDARNGGIESFRKLSEAFPEIGGASFIVETGSGGGSKHLYFKIGGDVPLLSHLNDYPGIDFKSSGFVVGAGSLHKSGNTYKVLVGSPSEIDDAPESLVKALTKPETYRARIEGAEFMDVSDAILADMVAVLSPDCDYETWFRVGAALHHASGGAAFDVWDNWSRGSSTKYPGAEALTKRWHSFGKSLNPVTIGTLAHYAEEAGWRQPVTFSPDVDFDVPAVIDDVFPCSKQGVDLLRPPGFVGEVCEWINSQCRNPRETLAVAAALTAMGNVAGLRYTDGLDGVGLNLFTFCVAGSGTGKESIMQAMTDIHRAAGIHLATHGSIKSEQEITRNLLRHQAAFYIIDEIGILLSKIENARKKGGAAYLDGVIGQLMAAYSKVNGSMLLTGDLKEEVRKAMASELAAAQKTLDEGHSQGGRIERRINSLKKALDTIDNGLDKPFLSLIGFTTPATFDGLVNRESTENGFIGRSLLVNELETNPKAKRGFSKAVMPNSLKNALASLYSGGIYDMDGGRIEFEGERIRIPTEDDAKNALDNILTYFENMGDKYKEVNGLEALPRRAYEMVAKISTILAVPGGVRTIEHVRRAFALVDRDIEMKALLVTKNADTNAPDKRLIASILGRIDKEHGETLGILSNRITKFNRDDIAKALTKMIELKLVVAVDSVNGTRKVRTFYAK
jgi:hypothetical protein